jgi:hypothetical protein
MTRYSSKELLESIHRCELFYKTHVKQYIQELQHDSLSDYLTMKLAMDDLIFIKHHIICKLDKQLPITPLDMERMENVLVGFMEEYQCFYSTKFETLYTRSVSRSFIHPNHHLIQYYLGQINQRELEFDYMKHLINDDDDIQIMYDLLDYKDVLLLAYECQERIRETDVRYIDEIVAKYDYDIVKLKQTLNYKPNKSSDDKNNCHVM